MNDQTSRSRITFAFNVALFVYSVSSGLLRFILSDKAKGFPIEGVVISSIADLLRFTIVMFITAYFIRETWNRLIASIFNLRNVNNLESIAIVLMISILTT